MPASFPELTVGLPAIKGLSGTVSSTTQLAISANMAVMRNPTTGALQFYNNITSKTLDISTTGAGGRDTGTFAAGDTIHIYFVGKDDGSTAHVVASKTAQTTGPTLPSTYTKWAYATSVVLDASVHLVGTTYFRGNEVLFSDAGNSGSSTGVVLLSLGVATTETSLATPLQAMVPANAGAIMLHLQLSNSTGTAGTLYSMVVRVVTTINADIIQMTVHANSATEGLDKHSRVPNVSRALFYLMSDAAMRGNIILVGYTVPN